jgi:hypothetical protein
MGLRWQETGRCPDLRICQNQDYMNVNKGDKCTTEGRKVASSYLRIMVCLRTVEDPSTGHYIFSGKDYIQGEGFFGSGKP